jgi:hypothetical protein
MVAELKRITDIRRGALGGSRGRGLRAIHDAGEVIE